jgi:hypothetical protein
MLHYLENLRKLPEPERKKAVLKLSLTITLVIVAIWTITLWIRIARTDFSFNTDGLNKNVPSLKETLSGFSDQIQGIFNTATDTPEEN